MHHSKKARMPKLVFTFICMVLFAMLAQAQVPTLRIADKDSNKVILKTLFVKVKVVANIAITTMEIEFCNNSKRDLEGELTFPLPDGVAINRFALDINGSMREAVPVEKEKGQIVFENTIRKRIDPALLEKLEGNSFKTRIYPLPAGGCRRIIIGYQQTLIALNEATLVYNLPMQSKKEIANFKFEMDVFSKSNPEVAASCNTKLIFTPRYNAFHTKVAEQNFTATGSFNIVIPKLAQGEDVLMQEKDGTYYFIINHVNNVVAKERTIPNNIQLIWDNSFSGLFRDHSKEIDFVKALMQRMKNGSIALSTIGYQFKNIGLYSVQNGACQALCDVLKSMTYDGATNLSLLKQDEGSAERILISDGMHTYGLMPACSTTKPLHTVTAAATANFGWLQKMALQNNGRFINLNTQIPSIAADRFGQQAYQLIGIKKSGYITSIYDNGFQAAKNITVTGISSQAKANITLQFGYGATISKEIVVELDANKNLSQDIDIDKIAAQQQIAFLELEYETNKTLIDSLGKAYNIVTRNTSLIVLDDVADYLRYGILPPSDLKKAYDSLVQLQQAEREELNKTIWEEALDMMDGLKTWHETDFSPVIQITVKDGSNYGKPMANVNVTANGKTIATNENGIAIFTGLEKATIEVTALNYITQKTTADGYDDNNRTIYLVSTIAPRNLPKGKKGKELKPSLRHDSLSFAFQLNRKGTTFAAPQAVGDLAVKSEDANSIGYQATISANNVTESGLSNGYFNANTPPTATIELKTIDSKKAYIKILKSQTADKWYSSYLQQRKANLLNPSFYVDVAKFFASNNQKELALQILSNIADMNTEDHESYKMLAFELKQMGEYSNATRIFKKVMEWRKQEPQSFRDYALSLADEGKCQNALDTLYMILNKSYNTQLMQANNGIEETILMDINSIVTRQQLNTAQIKKDFLTPLDVDVRVVLNWNMNDSDMDLWVTDPRGEKCYYSNKTTKIGGRISDDFTSGYGPEQFILHHAKKGKYKVQLHYYGDAIQKLAGGTTVMAEIYTNYGRSNQQSKMITLQLEKGEEQEGVLVGEFSFE